MKLVGKSLKHIEYPRLSRGEGTDVDDIKLLKMLYVGPKHSSHASVEIESIDVSKT